MTSPRIAVVCCFPAAPPSGGAGRVSTALAAALPAPTVLVQPGPVQRQWVTAAGLPVWQVGVNADIPLQKLLGMPAYIGRVARLLRAANVRLVVLEGASWAVYLWWLMVRLRRALPTATLLYHAHNVELLLRSQRHGRLVRRLTRWAEGRLLRDADQAFAVSAVDQALFAQWYEVRPALLPNGVDVAWFRTTSVAAVEACRFTHGLGERTILFMGAYAYPPNRAAIDFLVGQVMPRVIARHPDVTLVVTGGPVPYRRPWLRTPGLVPDAGLPALLHGCLISLVPIFSGSGTRLKILESLAAEVAVVATAKGAEGLELRPGRELLLAEDADDFATAIDALLREPRRRRALALRGQRRVARQYDWPRVAAALTPWYRAAMDSAGPCGAAGPAGPDATGERPRVLVCAYACNPGQGSEEAVGWNWVAAIASFCAVTVITATFHRPAIEAHVAAAPADHWSRRVLFVYPSARPWHYAPTPGWQRIEGSILKPLMHLAYRGWQAEAARLAGGLVARGGFDLTHQLTYVGFRFPGGLWRLPLPFVWGPLGGLEDTPWRLFPGLGPTGMLYFACRNLVNAAQRRWLRTPRQAAARAGAGLLAATSATARLLDRCFGTPAVVISEVTAPLLRGGPLPGRAADDPLRLVWSGAHTPGKALPLLLHALAGLPPRVRWTLDIFGSGPSGARWCRLARRLGLAPGCTWHGQVPRAEAVAALDAAHLFIITSLKDLTSTVLVEALSRGVPVLCPDHCGFADAVTDTAGRRLDIRSPGRFIAALTAAITDLHDHEPARQALAAGALARAVDFTIEAKAAALRAVYARLLAAGHGS